MKKVSPPQCLQNAFDANNLGHIDVFEFPDGTRSAADAANAIGCTSVISGNHWSS
jgi:hypothetical protein